MIARWLEPHIIESMKFRRVVHITGARQTGKTTLVSSIKFPKCRHYTMDNDRIRETAISDPIEFTRRADGEVMILDEVQKVPGLLNAIKIHVDQSTDRGQYLLTGSASLEFSKAVSDSLAGRMHTVRLKTLSLGEINGCKPHFLRDAFKREFATPTAPLNKKDIIHNAFCGGYPEAIDLPPRTRKEWYLDYIGTLIRRDIKSVTEIRKTEVLAEVSKWLLSRSSKLFTVDELCTVMGVAKPTIDNYINALSALYIFDRVPAWNKTDYDRIGKRSKYFASDPGLIANCLNWKEDSVYMDPDLSGKLVETWVFNQLSALADAEESNYDIYHYRDKLKREIDYIVTNEDDEILGIEVKSGGMVGQGDFKHLKWFAENLAKKTFTGIVLYSGPDILRFGDGFYAVPLATLGA
jgi:predicted AAA+ superfamily ATPase